MTSISILYGYHESGHYSVARAIQAALERQNVKAPIRKIFSEKSATWETLFATFRDVNGQSSGNFPGFFGDRDLLRSIAESVKNMIVSVPEDVLISTHPYTSYVAAEILSGTGRRIFDVHTNYTPGPIFPHTGIEGYFSPFPRPELPYRFRSTSTRCMVPVPPEFGNANGTFSKNCWVLSVGADGWGDTSDLKQLEKMLPNSIALNILTGRNEKLHNALMKDESPHNLVAFTDDISEYLKPAAFVFTKASGSVVSEAIACKCVPVFTKSYTPWELESARYLVEAGVGLHIDDFYWMTKNLGFDEVWSQIVSRAQLMRGRIFHAADVVANSVLHGYSDPFPGLLDDPEFREPGSDELGNLLSKKISDWTSRTKED